MADVFDEWGLGARKPAEAVEPAARVVDGHGEAAAATPIMDAALAWAARGFRVFPLTRGDKIPPKDLLWKIEATTDPAKIRIWWAHDPQFNYGVAGGDGLLIVDVDAHKNGYAALIDLDLPGTLTVKTPGGGMHLYLRGPDVQNSVDRIAPGVDIRSAGGYVVGPGSYFADPGAKKGYRGAYHIVDDREPAEAPNQFVLMAGEPRARDHGPAISIDEPDDIVFAIHYLQKDAPASIKGQGGNNVAYAVAARVLEIGVSVDLATELMLEHWNDRCPPGWAPDRLKGIVEHASTYMQRRQGSGSVAMMASEGGDPADTLPPVAEARAAADMQIAAAVDAVCDEASLAALLRRSPLLGDPILAGQPRPSIPWLVKKTLPRTGVGMIFGQSTSGKSYVVMDLAAKLWQGAPWFGAKVPERKASVIFAFEGADFAGYRLDALRVAAGGENPAILVVPANRMTTAGLKSIAPLLWGIDKFCRTRFGLAVGLVVIDTASAAGLAEKEDKADDVAPALKAVQEFAGTVGAFGLLVHHPNKAGAEMRGSGAWFNNTDVVLKLDVDSGGSVRTLTAEKVKDGPSPRELGSFVLDPITLGRDEDGEPITACVVAPAGKPTPQAAGGVAHFDKFVRAFEEAAQTRGANRNGRPFAPISEVNTLFREAVAPSFKSDSGPRTAWKRCFDFAKLASIILPVRGERNTFELTEAAYAPEDPNAVA